MAMTGPEGVTPFTSLLQAIDHLFEESGRAIDAGVAHSPTIELLTAGQPLPVDVYETVTEYILDAAVPGIPTSAIAISATPQSITLHAAWERGVRGSEQPGHYLCHERFEGEMRRRIGLPTPIDPRRISMTYANGVLTLRATKLAAEQPMPVGVQEAHSYAAQSVP